MTNKEAASLLGWLKSKTNREDDLEAIDMAIDALSVDGDLISRQDAIEAVRKEYEDAINIGDNGDAIAYDIERILSALPSAEAVQGEWVDIDNYYRMATCSHCHKVTMFEKWGEYTKPYDYCPNCGTRMYKGGDDK